MTRCESCGVAWVDHLGIMGTCADLMRSNICVEALNRELAAERDELRMVSSELADLRRVEFVCSNGLTLAEISEATKGPWTAYKNRNGWLILVPDDQDRCKRFLVNKDYSNAQDGSGYDGSWMAIGHDAEEAAKQWADADDSYGDYSIIGGSPARIRLTPEDGVGEASEFVVSGESVPIYRAHKIGATP